MSWVMGHSLMMPNTLLSSIPTFLRVMLRWHSARLCRSCWPRASCSSSRRLSRSSCWNSRSSNSLASVSSTSASFGHTRVSQITPSKREPQHPTGSSPTGRYISYSGTSCHAPTSYWHWPGTGTCGRACPRCPVWGHRQLSLRPAQALPASVQVEKAMEAPGRSELSTLWDTACHGWQASPTAQEPAAPIEPCPGWCWTSKCYTLAPTCSPVPLSRRAEDLEAHVLREQGSITATAATEGTRTLRPADRQPSLPHARICVPHRGARPEQAVARWVCPRSEGWQRSAAPGKEQRVGKVLWSGGNIN